MTLSIDDMSRLSDLARIEISESEKEELLQDLLPVVNYVSEINEVSADIDKALFTHANITKDDAVTNTEAMYTEMMLENAPNKHGHYFEVKQVL